MKTNYQQMMLDKYRISTVENTTIFQASNDLGIQIPQFCYNKRLVIAGNCRVCMVEVLNAPKPIVACSWPTMPNMQVYTSSPLVQKSREAVLEFILLNHPIDCPICDQGGECDLQSNSLVSGQATSRNFSYKNNKEDKLLGPIVKTVMHRCINCSRCVRFISQIGSFSLLGMVARGVTAEISAYKRTALKTEVAGNIADYCPVSGSNTAVQDQETADVVFVLAIAALALFVGSEYLQDGAVLCEEWIPDKEARAAAQGEFPIDWTGPPTVEGFKGTWANLVNMPTDAYLVVTGEATDFETYRLNSALFTVAMFAVFTTVGLMYMYPNGWVFKWNQ